MGVVSIDVDMSNLHPNNYVRYLDTLGNLLEQRVWRGGANKRIGGMLLTAWPIPKIGTTAEVEFLYFELLSNRIFRKNSGLPAWFAGMR
jgi:hypothetical protein